MPLSHAYPPKLVYPGLARTAASASHSLGRRRMDLNSSEDEDGPTPAGPGPSMAAAPIEVIDLCDDTPIVAHSPEAEDAALARRLQAEEYGEQTLYKYLDRARVRARTASRDRGHQGVPIYLTLYGKILFLRNRADLAPQSRRVAASGKTSSRTLL